MQDSSHWGGELSGTAASLSAKSSLSNTITPSEQINTHRLATSPATCTLFLTKEDLCQRIRPKAPAVAANQQWPVRLVRDVVHPDSHATQLHHHSGLPQRRQLLGQPLLLHARQRVALPAVVAVLALTRRGEECLSL
jgi:hypothetical protein